MYLYATYIDVKLCCLPHKKRNMSKIPLSKQFFTSKLQRLMYREKKSNFSHHHHHQQHIPFILLLLLFIGETFSSQFHYEANVLLSSHRTHFFYDFTNEFLFHKFARSINFLKMLSWHIYALTHLNMASEQKRYGKALNELLLPVT